MKILFRATQPLKSFHDGVSGVKFEDREAKEINDELATTFLQDYPNNFFVVDEPKVEEKPVMEQPKRRRRTKPGKVHTKPA